MANENLTIQKITEVMKEKVIEMYKYPETMDQQLKTKLKKECSLSWCILNNDEACTVINYRFKENAAVGLNKAGPLIGNYVLFGGKEKNDIRNFVETKLKLANAIDMAVVPQNLEIIRRDGRTTAREGDAIPNDVKNKDELKFGPRLFAVYNGKYFSQVAETTLSVDI